MHEGWWLCGSVRWDKLRIPKSSCHIPVGVSMPYRRKTSLDARMQFRVSEKEKRDVVDQADKAGMTLSTYCRLRILGRKVNVRADEQMVRELRRQGGQLKNLHNRSGGLYSKKTAEVLDSIGRAIDRIGRSSSS